MKTTSTLLAALLSMLLLFQTAGSARHFAAKAGNTPEELPYYVVIGAFTLEGNAKKLVAQSAGLGHDAVYAFNYKRNLFYVFVLRTDDREDAYSLALQLRTNPVLEKTWVYHGTFTVPSMSTVEDLTHALDDAMGTGKDSVLHKKINTPSDTIQTVTHAIYPGVVLNSFRKDNGKAVYGNIKAVDGHTSTVVGIYAAHKPAHLEEIAGNLDNITFIADIFGYRKVIEKIGTSLMKTPGVPVEVPFELVRLKKGDIANLDVVFEEQAAILNDSSATELDRLTEMLNENKRYKILIHSHTYFGDKRKLMVKGARGDFFDLDKASRVTGNGKKLASARGELLKSYLASKRIDTKRVHTKSWGDARPIYGKQSEQFKLNERTEIEILRD